MSCTHFTCVTATKAYLYALFCAHTNKDKMHDVIFIYPHIHAENISTYLYSIICLCN